MSDPQPEATEEAQVVAEVHVGLTADAKVLVSGSHQGPALLGLLDMGKDEVLRRMRMPKRPPRVMVPGRN